MKPHRPHITRHSLLATCCRAAFAGAALALSALSLGAQAAQDTPLTNQGEGAIHGTVYSALTTDALEGAEITLQPSGRRTNAARDGTFYFGNVPPGDASLTVAYPGLATQTITLAVTPGRLSETTVNLKDDDVVALEAFVVQGAKEGMSKAIAMQKAADDLRMIAAADQFGDYAGNLGEYLQFIPGVLPDGGDMRAVSLRGMAPFLTTLTLDDSDVASASSGSLSRITELETFSLSNVETIEVIKTLTPDRPATNTAGSINMISKSAFDMKKPFSIAYRAYLRAPGTFALERYKDAGSRSGREMTYIRPNIELDFMRKIGKNFGFYIGARAYETVNWLQAGTWRYSFNPNTGGLPNDPAPDRWLLRKEVNLQTRHSASARLDWKISPLAKWSFSAAWNDYEVKNARRNQMYLNLGTRPALATLEKPQYTLSTQNFRSAVSSAGAENGSIDTNVFDRNKKATVAVYASEFETRIASGGMMKAKVYYSTSDNKYTSSRHYDNADTRISNVGLYTSELVDIPHWTIMKDNAYLDLADITKQTVRYADIQPSTALENRYGGSFYYLQKLPFALSTSIKVGAQWDGTDREINGRRFRTAGTLVSAGDALLALRDDVVSSRPAALGFPGQIAFIDLNKLWSLYGDVPVPSYNSGQNDTFATYNTEKTAAYLRVDFKPADNLLIIAGVRHENVREKSQNTLADTPGAFNTKDEFYSVNIKYTPSPNQIFRASVTQSMGLPNYSDLLPVKFTITRPSESDDNQGRVALSNPNLQPYKVDNFDLSYEYHFRKTGVITLAVFRKAFKNYIVQSRQTLSEELAASVGFNTGVLEGDLLDYDLITRFNAKDKGYYNGIELAFREQLTFLPRPFNTLGLQVGFTFIDVTPIRSSQVFNDNPAENATLLWQVERALEIGATPISGSLALNWGYRKFYFRATLAYSGRTVRSASRDTIKYSNMPEEYLNLLTRTESRTIVDLSIEYRWKSYFTPYLQLRNFMNSNERQSVNGYKTSHVDRGNPAIELGIRGKF